MTLSDERSEESKGQQKAHWTHEAPVGGHVQSPEIGVAAPSARRQMTQMPTQPLLPPACALKTASQREVSCQEIFTATRNSPSRRSRTGESSFGKSDDNRRIRSYKCRSADSTHRWRSIGVRRAPCGARSRDHEARRDTPFPRNGNRW